MRKNYEPSTGMEKQRLSQLETKCCYCKKNPKNKVKKGPALQQVGKSSPSSHVHVPSSAPETTGNWVLFHVLLMFWCLGFFFLAKILQKYPCYRFPTISRKSRFHTLRQIV